MIECGSRVSPLRFELRLLSRSIWCSHLVWPRIQSLAVRSRSRAAAPTVFPSSRTRRTALALKTPTPCNLSELKCFEGAQLTPAEATLAG